MEALALVFAVFAFVYGPIWLRDVWDDAGVKNGTHHWEWNRSHRYAARNHDIDLGIHDANKKVLEHESKR